jgi:hypothetical protein
MTMWAEFLHHLTLHFPIVLSMVVASVGLWSLRDDAPQLRAFVRWAGWICLAFTTVTVAAGVIAAPGLLGGEGPDALSHHRNLGVTTWVVTAIAAAGYEFGMRRGIDDWRKFGVGVWCVVVLGVIGTGHWGGTELHEDKLPWTEETGVEQDV